MIQQENRKRYQSTIKAGGDISPEEYNSDSGRLGSGELLDPFGGHAIETLQQVIDLSPTGSSAKTQQTTKKGARTSTSLVNGMM